MLPLEFYQRWDKFNINEENNFFVKLFLNEFKNDNLIKINILINKIHEKDLFRLLGLVRIKCSKKIKIILFLMKYPQYFIIDELQNNISKQQKTDQELNEELRNTFCLRSINFFKLLLNIFGFNRVPIKEISKYLFLATNDIHYYFGSYNLLKWFLQKNSNDFILDETYIILKEINEISLTKNLHVPKLDVLDIDKDLLSKTILIDNLKDGLNIIDYILNNIKVVAFDSEGINIGSKFGKITLIQIAYVIPLKDNFHDDNYIINNTKVYLFDILKCPSLMKLCIEKLLSSNEVLKIIHDFRSDCFALKNEHKIGVKNVFDTQKAYLALKLFDKSGLYSIYEQFTGCSTNLLKKKMKKMYYFRPHVWERRPLTDFFIYYAALDVFALLRIYYIMINKYIKDDYNNYIIKTTEKK